MNSAGMETLNMNCLLPYPSNLSCSFHQGKSVPRPAGYFGPGSEMKVILGRRPSVVCLAVSAPSTSVRNANENREKSSDSGSEIIDEAVQRKWRKMMREIEGSGSAIPVLRSLRTKRQPLPKNLVLGTIVRFKQLKEWKIVSEIIEWLRCQHWWIFSEMDFNMLISAYGKQGDFEKAEGALRSMKRSKFPMNVVTYTALIEAYGKAGHYKKAESIFRRMQLSGPEPTILTYQTMIKMLVEGGKFEEAETIFRGILDDEKSTVKPDQKMFHMMIYMYKKAGKRDQARQLYGQMVANGIPLSTVTFNSLMTCETDFKEASRIFDQLQRAGFRPDVVSYTLLINAYGKARREEDAQEVFNEMVDAGVRPTRKAYNVLLDAYANSASVEGAAAVFKRMTRDKCRPDLCSYTTLLSAYVNASDMQGAEKLFVRLKRDGIVPSVVTYGTLMKGYAKVDDLERMMKTYEEMRLQGIQANQTIFTTLMDAHGKRNDFGSAVIWFKEMVAAGCKPDEKAKNILQSLPTTAEEKQEASELVQS